MAKHDQEVENIIDGLTGDIRIGQRYYFFTVTYAYIGRVKSIGKLTITLDESDAWIVSRAGSEDDAVTKIVNGKKKPENYEVVGKPVQIFTQSLTCAIPF